MISIQIFHFIQRDERGSSKALKITSISLCKNKFRSSESLKSFMLNFLHWKTFVPRFRVLTCVLKYQGKLNNPSTMLYWILFSIFIVILRVLLLITFPRDISIPEEVMNSKKAFEKNVQIIITLQKQLESISNYIMEEDDLTKLLKIRQKVLKIKAKLEEIRISTFRIYNKLCILNCEDPELNIILPPVQMILGDVTWSSWHWIKCAFSF